MDVGLDDGGGGDVRQQRVSDGGVGVGSLLLLLVGLTSLLLVGSLLERRLLLSSWRWETKGGALLWREVVVGAGGREDGR